LTTTSCTFIASFRAASLGIDLFQFFVHFFHILGFFRGKGLDSHSILQAGLLGFLIEECRQLVNGFLGQARLVLGAVSQVGGGLLNIINGVLKIFE